MLKKLTTNAEQRDEEDSSQRLSRLNKLRAQKKELTLTPMPEDEHVGILIGGLRAGYNVLTNSWALDEVRGDAENGGPSTLDELSSALRKFESNRSFKASTKPQSPSNFATHVGNRSNPSGGRVKNKSELKCFSCAIAGRDSNHDFKECKHSQRWRKENGKDKGNDREITLVTSKKKRKIQDDDDDDDYDYVDDPVSPEESDAEVEDAAPPIRTNRLRIKKKKNRNA